MTLSSSAALAWLSIAFPYFQNIKQDNLNYVSLKLPASVVGKYGSSIMEKNRKIALQVEKILRKDGIHNDKVILAMLVNMWHESSWSPKAKSGSCVGLFQLHTKYSGRGMTLAQLTNVNDHMYRLLSLDCYKKWKNWAIKSAEKTTCGHLAFTFASEVERCANAFRQPRAVTANKWWNAYSKV